MPGVLEARKEEGSDYYLKHTLQMVDVPFGCPRDSNPDLRRRQHLKLLCSPQLEEPFSRYRFPTLLS